MPLGINLGVNVRVVRLFAHMRTDIDVVYTYRVAITFVCAVGVLFWILFTSLKDILPMAFFDDECAALSSALLLFSILLYMYTCTSSSVCLMGHERLCFLLQGYDSDGLEGHAAHSVHCDLPRRSGVHRVFFFHQKVTRKSRLCTQCPYHTTCRLISRLIL